MNLPAAAWTAAPPPCHSGFRQPSRQQVPCGCCAALDGFMQDHILASLRVVPP